MDAAGIKVDDKINVTFDSNDGSIVFKAADTDNEVHNHFSEILDRSLNEDQAILDFIKNK